MSYPAHSGFFGNSGVQAHSCGEIYPWHIVIRGDNTVYAQHCDGRKLTEFSYGESRSFKTAHRLAEAEAAEELLRSGERFDLAAA